MAVKLTESVSRTIEASALELAKRSHWLDAPKN
jgi:hypothetical protein